MNNSLVSVAVSLAVISPLSYADEQTIEKMVVVSSRIAQPLDELSTSVTTLDEADIQARFGYAVSDILRTVPSVNVSNAGGIGKNTTVRVRGEEGFRTKLYLDGVELSDPTAPQIGPIFDDILSGDFERIEILRGTHGFAYGADAGGIIGLYSSRPDVGLSGSAGAELSSFDSKRSALNLGLANQSSLVQISANRFDTDGFNAKISDSSGERDGYQNQTVHLRAETQLTDNFALQYVLRNNDGETEYDGCFDNTTFAQINDCVTESDYQTQRLSGHYQRDNIRHEFGYSKTEVTRTFFNAGLFGFENKGDIEQFDLLGQIDLGSQQLVYGADLKKESDLVNHNSRDQHGVYAEFLGTLDSQFNYSIGLRFDDNDTFGQFSSYRVAGSYEWTLHDDQSLRLKASYGTGFRAPSLFEQAYNDGPFAYGDAAGLALAEEQSEGIDIGLHYQPTAATQISLTWFDQEIENEIMFDAVAFQGYLQANGRSDSRGIELEVSHDLSQKLQIWGNYTYNDTQDSNGDQRLRRPENIYNLGIQGSWYDDRLQVSVFAHRESDAIDVGGVPLDAYTTVNSNISWLIRDNVTVILRANNLFDDSYQEVSGFNSAGQTTSLGLKLTF
ncbi:MAG: TonB-dependent receptor plug domain-containing protein [Aestuariibacter sp.]